MLERSYPDILPQKLLESVTTNREGMIKGECCVLISAVDGSYPQGKQMIKHLGLPMGKGDVYMILVVVKQEENRVTNPGSQPRVGNGIEGSEGIVDGIMKPWRVLP
jgi:hypothetical protein